MPDNVDKLFEIMQAKGAASDRGKFRKVFLTPGNKGYKIRKDIYDGLRADGIIDSPTYEDFRRKLRLGGTPTVNKYRQQMFNSVDPNKSRASELTNRAVGQAVRATNNVRKPVTAKVVNRKGKPIGEEFAITPAKTVEDLDREYAQETTKNWENELHDQMADADKDAAKISDMFKSFIGSTDEVGSVWGNMTRGGGIAGTPHSVTTNNGIMENTEARQILAAGDYNRKRRELLQLEQDSRNGAIFDNHSFFRGMYDAAKDTGFLTGGASDLINAGSLLATKQDLDNGVHTEAGDMLMQQAVKNSNAQSQYGDNQGWMYTGGVITTNMAPFMVQIGSAGFSKGMSNAIGKVVQSAASKVALGMMNKAIGLTSTHVANIIGKMTGLTTKAFGKAIQYGIVGAAQANTVGLGNVANDVINRYTGQVYQDEQGNYKFGTFDSDGNLVHEGGEDFLTALVKGEAAQTIEFATELAGGGIDAAGTALKNFVTKGGKKIINKYNMENVSKVIDFLLNNKVAKNARYLKAGADRTLGKVEVNSIVGESLEEELGIIANTVFTGDNKISDLWDEKQQSQIWGGMLLSIGLMKGAVAPFHAYNAKQYYSYKHKLDKADVNLSQLLGKEKWEELRNQIDTTTNDDMPEMVNRINRDVALGKNRQPVREYIQNLLIMRGYDIGNMLAAKKAVEDKGEGVSVKNMEKNQAYQQGRDAYGYDTHEIQLDQEDKQKSLAQLLGISEQQLASMSDEELDALSGRDDNIDRAIYDYQLSTARYEGVIDNARDQIDLEVQRAAQAVDMYTDKSRNTIRNATIKATGGLEDYGVYIINGNIATHEDGSIDISNSDDMILYYDPTTNTVEHADAMMFAELGSEENADEVRSQAMADAKEKAIKETTGIIDGVVEVGTQFKTVDADGTEHTYEVLADNGDGTAMITIDGNIPTELVKGENVNIPVSFEELQKMKDESDQQRLQAAKAQREQMEKERAEQQNQETEETQPSFDFKKILNDNGNVVLADVLDEDGNTRYPNSKLFLIRDSGAKAKVVELKSDGTLKSHAVDKKDVRTATTMSLDEYKQAMAESSMIEDNSGENRGEIEAETSIIEDAEPIGTGAFGNIYNQFKGKVKEAFNFLMSHKSGDLLGVFHRDDVGDIDLVWGNEKMGLAHILGKHVGEGKDFETPDDAIEMIENVINSGRIFQDNQNRYTLMLDGVGVGIRKSFDGEKKNWIVTAVDFNRSQEEKGIVTNPTSTSHGVTESESAAALNDSDGKDINNSANDNENNESLTFEDGTPIPVDENGETDLSQTDAAHAAEWYDNNLGEDADDWLDGEIKKAKKVLEQAQNKKVTGTKPSELVASKKEKEAAIADAQAHYDSAISIRDSLKERRIAKEENTAEGRKELIEKERRKFARLKSAVKDDAEAVAQLYKETVGSLLHRLYDGTGIDVTDTIPLTAEEYVASNLGAHSLNYEGTETSKGVKQETGLNREDFAKTQLLAADGKGTTIDNLVHSLWENRPSNLDSLGTQEIRNALLSVITSGFKASEARNYIENLRIAQAENFLEEQKKAADNAAFAEENKAESEQQTETATESEEKTGEDNSDEINDEDNEKINEQTNENINAPEVPEDATEENPLGLQLSEDKVPFEIEGGKSGETYNINDNEDRQRLINDNKVDDKDILDIDMPKHVHKAIKELCKKMGLKVQFLYMGARSNGWIENGTMYLALDTEMATQFVFGHEMTHAIKQKNPEAYKELVKVAMAVTTKKKFEEDLAKVYQNYHGISGYNNVDDYVEEVVADNLGKFINNFDLAQKFSLRLNHPVLATILHAIQKIKSLLYGDFYKSVDALERIVEKAYVDTAKGEVTNSETGEDVSFSLRQKPEPKKKGIGYKVFVLKDGKLYPPMVANPDGAATPVGVWLDADAAPIAGESKTGRPQVKQGGKGTQGGSGKLAYRPGWHLGVVPYAIQFNRKDAEGNKTLFPKNFVFAEVEYAADVDYQEEARQEGINPSGKYQHSLAGLKHLPTDGYYMYRTNPNPETDPWVITGAMKVNRILTRAEQAELVKKTGREPQQIQEGDIVTDDVVNSINQEIADAPKFSLKDPFKMSDNEKKERGDRLIKAPAINVASGVIQKTADLSARKAAEKWWNENVAKPLVFNTEVGDVEINDKSIKDSLAHRYRQPKLDAITSLPDGFGNAVYLGTMKDFTRDGDVNNHYFAYPINYDGQRNYVFCRAMQDANKNRLYVHEVFVADKINEGNTLQTTASQPHGGIALYKEILANVLSAAKIDNSSETTKENGEKFSLKDEKTLAGVHNITEEKLRKALKLGGFANPSLAVIDTNKTGHDNFGEISFIAPSALVDKRTGKTAGTWITDAYTQRYPSVEREMSEKGSQKFRDWVDSLEYPSEAKAEIKRQAEDALSNNNAPAWELMYLKEKGIDIKEYDSRIDYRWKEIIKDHPTVEDILNSMNTDPELNEKVTGLAKHIIVDPIRGKISLEVRRKIYEETGVKMSSLNPQVRKQTKEIFERDYAPSLLNKNGTPKKSDVKKVVEQMVKEHNDTKKYDFYLSKVKASNYVNKNGLYDDYIRWQENKLDEFGTKNRIFRGYTKDGSRKYVPETLENVSKAMREEADGQTNGSEYTSFGSFIAKLASRVDSTDEMRANKDKLSSNKDKEEFYEKWSDVYYDLAKFFYNDVFYGEQRLHDIVLQSDPKKYAKKEYGITLTPTFMKKLDALKNAVQTELKSAYFETKYNRPLRLNEFAAAVVPDNLGEDVRKGIENAGLPMYDYDPNKEGDRSRAFNEAINSRDNIKFSLKSMMAKPEGWKQANKKAIHIAEAIERDPKFSLKNLDGTLIKAGTYFSGGGLVEEGLKGIIDPVVAVEYDEKISGVYRNNFGNHIVTADVRDVDPKELVGKIDGEVEYFHASPVCKNYSLAKNNHEELELDKETAASTAEFISKVRPKVVTIENVKGYKDSEAMKTITDALDEAGYKWDADVYNAADYGGYTNRERLIVRAVRDGELPAKPEKQKRKSGWYEAVEDIIPTLTEKKNGVAPWMDERLKADGIDWRHIDKPLYVMGSGYANGTVPHAFADELLPTLRTKSGDVIVMPDGKVYRAMGRVLARVSGVSDDYQMPASEALSHTIIGNGIPTQLTENVIAPLVRDVLHPAVEERASLKDADRKQAQLDIILKTNPMLDDYHTGIRKVEDIKTLGESVEEARSEAEKYGDDEWSAYPDITNDMLQNALETGEITIYSSKPIKNGVFVTPSYMQASDYAGGGNVYEKTVSLTDVAWINTDEGQYAKVDGERYSLKEVNDKFNDRLAQLIENPNQKDRVLHLGRSSQFLIDGGIADAEIELDFDKFVRKSSEKYKNNHPFSAGDIKDLPKAIAHPVAVFNSTTKKDHIVMTELNHDGKNFIVAIRATEQNRKNKVVLEVNQITSLYPKGERGIIYWINNNKLSNVDKEKALHFIEALQPHAGTLTSEELSSAANIVRNFVNPKQNDGNLQKTEKYSLRVDRYRDELNQWKKDNNLPKDAERPQLPVREPNENAADFLKRVKEYRRQAALWATAPTYEDHLLVSDTAQGQFNLEMQRKAVLTRIVIQDSMLAIRKAQEAIMKEKGVDKLNPAEDAYTAENRSHGKAKNEFEEYNDEFLQPLRKAYNELMQRLGKSYDNVKVYMIAKHGLERNAYIAFKYALDEDYETNEERMNAYNNYKADMDRLNNDADFEAGRIDFAAWKQRDGFIRTKYAPSYFKFRFDENGMTKDYSGLSALFDADDYEGAAADLVKEVEDANPYYTDELWYATNDATKKILRDSYNAGMMTEDNFNFVSGMYRNYIPLRGWGDTNADQVWNYVGGGKGAFNQVVKEAKGRKSLADDPIAYIENMAESAILMNNRNWVKQHLLLLAQNHRTSLLNVSKAWYIKTKDAQGNEEWIPASPQIIEGMTGKQVEAALEAFEQKMEQMQQNGEATQKREHLEISYPQTNGEEREHEVRVMKGGEEYVIYVNGDPQLAQAVNNTRARKVREGLESSISAKVIARTGRYMAAAYTSMSPLFIPSNYMRDLTMTLASTAIREDARYNYLLRRNMLRHWNTFPMVLSYQNGTLREKVRNGSASRVEQMFYDFMMNGGETGFVTSVDVEDLKKKFRNDLKDLNRMAANPKKVGHIIMNSIETLNRAIEDSNRFMVYMTSIEYGRSIEEAVNNAKDVTLNFNRKGTGEHWMQNIRNLYLFINPAIQSLQTLGALAKHHRFKFTTVTTGWLASGLLAPMLNNLLMSFFGGDDDKDKYWQFTKWDRRNNFIMWIPFTKEFVKIPLAQEFRGFYGVGDMIASKLWGGEKAEESWRDYAVDLAGQIVDMLPLDPTGYDGNVLIALMPNVFRPIFELGDNVDFTGKPIFRNSEYNKYDPNFTKAYVGTPDWLVRISKMVNSIDNKYPDVQQNAIDRFGNPRFNLNNPAVVDHVLSSYLGGAYTMGSQILGVATKALNGDDIKMADIPLASKFVSNPDDRPVSKKQGEEFWDMKERHDRAANTLSKLKKKAKVDGDYSTLDIFFGSDEYRQYKEDDKKVKKYEEDRKKEKAQETGEAYRPHKTTADDVYKSHTTPKDDFEDMKMKQLYEKLNSYKIRYEAIDGISGERGDAYYKANKAAIDAIEEIAYDKSQIASIKKGFLSDGQNTYDADGMKDIRELRKRILDVLEKANKVMLNNRK
jgi:site-specific DNA-cytosine methylase